MKFCIDPSRACAAATAFCAALALSACATFSADGGFGSVSAATRAHLDKDVRWPRSEDERAKRDQEVARLLAEPLSAEDAVQVALLNNRGLQASFENLGISEADLVKSGRLPNPSFMLRHTAAAGQADVEQAVTINVLALAAAPFAHDIDKRRFEQAKQRASRSVARLAAETRHAFFRAVAAAESVRYLEQVTVAAESGAELARRMHAAGNWTVLDQSRERGFHSEAVQNLAAAQLASSAAAGALMRLLGLTRDGPTPRLADRLPDLPQFEPPLAADEAALLRDRIDLRLERLRMDELAHVLGLVKATRFINVLDAGPARIRQGADSAPYEHGYEVNFEVPIFDGGGPRVRRAQALYAQAVDHYEQSVIDARAEIGTAAAAYRAAFAIARLQRDEVIPMRKQVAAENLLRYNASLVSVFELLSDASAEIASVDTYIRSVRDFWIAKSDFDATLLGGEAFHDDP